MTVAITYDDVSDNRWEHYDAESSSSKGLVIGLIVASVVLVLAGAAWWWRSTRFERKLEDEIGERAGKRVFTNKEELQAEKTLLRARGKIMRTAQNKSLAIRKKQELTRQINSNLDKDEADFCLERIFNAERSRGTRYDAQDDVRSGLDVLHQLRVNPQFNEREFLEGVVKGVAKHDTDGFGGFANRLETLLQRSDWDVDSLLAELCARPKENDLFVMDDNVRYLLKAIAMHDKFALTKKGGYVNDAPMSEWFYRNRPAHTYGYTPSKGAYHNGQIYDPRGHNKALGTAYAPRLRSKLVPVGEGNDRLKCLDADTIRVFSLPEVSLLSRKALTDSVFRTVHARNQKAEASWNVLREKGGGTLNPAQLCDPKTDDETRTHWQTLLNGLTQLSKSSQSKPELSALKTRQLETMIGKEEQKSTI